MPSIQCQCGTRLRFGEIPNPIEFLLVADTEFDKVSEDQEWGKLYERMTHMLRCPVCSRLWVFWNGFSELPSSYHAE
jgi:hypothetical protein